MRKMFNILLMGEIRRLPVEVGSLYHHLHWLYISQVVVWNFFHQPYTFLGGGLWCMTRSPKKPKDVLMERFPPFWIEPTSYLVYYTYKISALMYDLLKPTNCDVDKEDMLKTSIISKLVCFHSFRVSEFLTSFYLSELGRGQDAPWGETSLWWATWRDFKRSFITAEQ